MLKHLSEFHVFRNHPLLDAIGQRLATIGDAHSVALLQTHIAFLYPKILAISFVGKPLPDGLGDSDLSDNPDDGSSYPDVSTSHREDKGDVSVESADFLRFLKELAQCLRGLDAQPIVLLDLRNEQILDEPLLVKSLDILGGIAHQVLILGSTDIKEELLQDLRDRAGALFFATSDLKDYLRGLWRRKDNSVDLILPDVVNIQSLDECFDRINAPKMLANKFAAVLDLTRVNAISFFAMQQLLALMHTKSRRAGILWGVSSSNSAITNKLLFHRFFEGLGPIFDRHYIPSRLDASSETLIEVQNSSGVYAFDESLQSNLIEATDKYMGTLRRNYSRYLDQYVSMTYDPKFRSLKPTTYRLTHYQIIRLVIAELIENVVLHSGGLGFFAALANENILSIYVGDCGVGVRRGILKNYDLNDLVPDDREALKYLFQLDSFRDRRIEKRAFNEGAGFGLRDTLQRIFACRGKLICRSGKQMASFMNPVSKTSAPSFQESLLSLHGVHFMIVIPLSDRAVGELPRGTAEFLTSMKL